MRYKQKYQQLYIPQCKDVEHSWLRILDSGLDSRPLQLFRAAANKVMISNGRWTVKKLEEEKFRAIVLIFFRPRIVIKIQNKTFHDLILVYGLF